MSQILFFPREKSSAETIVESLSNNPPEHLIAIAYKDDTYVVYITEVSKTFALGALALIGHEILTTE
jgi:hypothetical protein